VFPIPIRLHAGIVERYIDRVVDADILARHFANADERMHGLIYAIEIGLDDFRTLGLVGPRRQPYALLLSKIADLRRSIHTVFENYTTEFLALSPTHEFADLVISHANDAETDIITGLERFTAVVGDAANTIQRDLVVGNCLLGSRRSTMDEMVTHALAGFRLVVCGALDGHIRLIQYRCHGFLNNVCRCHDLYTRPRRDPDALDH
jgi:hypothetical protein